MDELGIFADMHLEEIIEFMEKEGYWCRVFHSYDLGKKSKWLMHIKVARADGMPRSEYAKLEDSTIYRHVDLMTAAREAACKVYYGEPEIVLAKDDKEAD